MIKKVSLLVCLSPSVSSDQITELNFYHIINPIIPVINLKLISKEGQMKAFVQVENESAANTVLNKLHCKLLNVGKVKVFISNKRYINYDKLLQEILMSSNNILQQNNLRIENKSLNS